MILLNTYSTITPYVYGTFVIDLKNVDGWTPLHNAAWYNSVDVVRLLPDAHVI